MAATTSLRSMLHRDARTLGNIEVAKEGPVSFALYARRKVCAKSNGPTRESLRSLGRRKQATDPSGSGGALRAVRPSVPSCRSHATVATRTARQRPGS